MGLQTQLPALCAAVLVFSACYLEPSGEIHNGAGLRYSETEGVSNPTRIIAFLLAERRLADADVYLAPTVAAVETEAARASIAPVIITAPSPDREERLSFADIPTGTDYHLFAYILEDDGAGEYVAAMASTLIPGEKAIRREPGQSEIRLTLDALQAPDYWVTNYAELESALDDPLERAGDELSITLGADISGFATEGTLFYGGNTTLRLNSPPGQRFVLDGSEEQILMVASNEQDLFIERLRFIDGGTFGGPDGGALEIAGGTTARIIDSEFENNQGDDGGAIYSDADLTIIESSRFENNSAEYGGAILSWSEVHIVDSVFAGNVADGGGAVKNYDGGATVIERSTFVGNMSNGGPGGAFRTYNELEIIDSEFIENESADDGGAVYGSGDDMTINDSRFEANASDEFGGAVALSSVTPTNVLDVENSDFIGNSAGGIGGAIFTSAESTLTVVSSRFVSNLASGGFGGAIFVDNATELGVTVSSEYVDNSLTHVVNVSCGAGNTFDPPEDPPNEFCP